MSEKLHEENIGTAERDGVGRFRVGNPGGPGNPFAREVAALRRAMLSRATAEDVGEIIAALIQKAKEGHVPAAKLVLGYLVGKPEKAVDPDRMDAHEWELQKETAAMTPEMAKVVGAPPAELALRQARVLRPLMGSLMEHSVAELFRKGEEKKEEAAEEESNALGETEAQGVPSANGHFGGRLAEVLGFDPEEAAVLAAGLGEVPIQGGRSTNGKMKGKKRKRGRG